MKNWIFTFLVAGSFALASTNPIPVSKLPQIIDKPNAFKPDEYYTDSRVNLGYLINQWIWNFGTQKFGDELSLSKTKDGKGWKLDLSYSGYKIDNLAKSKTKLYVLKDLSTKQTITTYQINFGKYKNVYLRQAVFKDGSSSIDIQNREFVVFEGESSEFKRGEAGHLVAYNIYGYLFFKSKFCVMNDTVSSTKCAT